MHQRQKRRRFGPGLVSQLRHSLCLHAPVQVKNLTIHGIYWGSYQHQNPRLFLKSLEEVARLYGGGQLAVGVSHRFSLEQAPEAFAIMLNRQVGPARTAWRLPPPTLGTLALRARWLAGPWQ